MPQQPLDRDRTRAKPDIPEQLTLQRLQRRQRHRTNFPLRQLAIMLEKIVVKAGSQSDDDGFEFRDHLDGNRVERLNLFDIKIRSRRVTYALARATHGLKHGDSRLSHAMRGQKFGKLARRRAVPGERQNPRTGLQVPNDTIEVAAVERDQRDVLQRPAHPRGGETESGGLWQTNELIGLDKGRNLLADTEMKGIAARENRDGMPAMAFDLGERITEGARPRQRPASNKFARQFQMARAAHHQLGRTDQLEGDGGKSFHAVLTNANDRQPARPCANCGLSHHGTGPDARSHPRRYDRGLRPGASACGRPPL